MPDTFNPKKRRTSIYIPESLYKKIQKQAIEDGLTSTNQRIVHFIYAGFRSETQAEREHIKITADIQRLVKEEYKRQSLDEYIKSDRFRPLNKHEMAKHAEQETADRKSNPPSADYDDEFSKIYDGVEKQEELEEKAERYLQSNWHPDFLK